MISRQVIDQIRETARIEEVVGDYVSLKRKGQNQWACCPFHQEKSPSFSVSPSKGIFKCFGCGKSGDSIGFIMEIEGLGYLEAIRALGKKYGIEVKEEEQSSEAQQEQNEREAQLIAMNFACRYYETQLKEAEEGQSIGLSYFKERGFNSQTIETFQLGYSPASGQALHEEALAKGYQEQILLNAGLLSESNGRLYDRFRGRVMFPIHNVSGKVIAFGARMMGNDKNQPKYLNSPETLLYHKKNILYGIAQARQAIRQKDNCYLTEGYTDVLTLHQAGVSNVVASSGTSLTEEQIRLIKRYTDNVTVLYDGDQAGIKASFRGIDLLLQEGLNVRAVTFPDGEDPDSYCRKVGADAFQAYLQVEVRDFMSFMLGIKLAEAGKDPLKKAEIVGEIVGSIALIDDTIKRAVYLKECSIQLQMAEDVLIAELNKRLIKKRKEDKQRKELDLPEGVVNAVTTLDHIQPQPIIGALDLRSGYEREICRLLLSYGHISVDEGRFVVDYLFEETGDVPFMAGPFQEFMLAYQSEAMLKPGTDLSPYFMAHEREDLRKMAIELLSSRYEISEAWKEHDIEVPREQDILSHVVVTTVLRLKWQHIRKLIEENQKVLQSSEIEEETDLHQKIHFELKQTEKELAGKLGIVVAGR